MKTKRACSFTGHRNSSFCFGYDENDEKCKALKRHLVEAIVFLIKNKHIKVFNTGMAIGFDMWAAEIVIELKKTYTDIQLIAYLPSKEPNSKWPQATKDRYNSILSECDDVVCCASSIYKRNDVLKRNRALIDNCCCVIACYNGKSSGTGFTVNYAKEKNLPMVNLWKQEYAPN